MQLVYVGLYLYYVDLTLATHSRDHFFWKSVSKIMFFIIITYAKLRDEVNIEHNYLNISNDIKSYIMNVFLLTRAI